MERTQAVSEKQAIDRIGARLQDYGQQWGDCAPLAPGYRRISFSSQSSGSYTLRQNKSSQK